MTMKLDPLYTIFEKHLYDIEKNEDSEMELIDNIVNDYLRFLESNKVAVPKKWQPQIIDELRDQVRQMIIKKMYGCLSAKEFVVGQRDLDAKRKRAKKKYTKLF